jgi:hypothetical protein
MQRRTVLRRAGATLAVGLAGCVGDGTDEDDAASGESPTETAASTPTATGTRTRTPTATATDAATTTPSGPERTPHRGTAPLAPGVTERTVTDEGSCSGEDGTGAAVTFADDAVVVSGQFSTPVPCFTVDVAGSTSDGTTYEISLVPERMGAEDDPVVCRQCLGRVTYEARIRFESRPGTVVVRHGGETVARADR